MVFCSSARTSAASSTSAPNVLLTPHQAFNGRETGERVSLAAAQAIVDLMHGKKPTHVVNGDVFQSAALRAKLK